jgi:IS30 family transposase
MQSGRSRKSVFDPFASWQRRSNENLNGLIRQYISQSRPFSSVTDSELASIETRLNNRPRKRLGFKTTHELFTQELGSGPIKQLA